MVGGIIRPSSANPFPARTQKGAADHPFFRRGMGSMSMTTPKPADVLRAEHKTTVALMAELEKLVSALPKQDCGDWLDALRFHFGRFRAHLKSCFRAEETDGFMAPVLEIRPTLAREVEQLKNDHRELSQSLDEIERTTTELRPSDMMPIEDVCHRIERLIASVKRHAEREELLVMSVFNQDIGTHD
jgi:hemerythrin-like domain-containing protein